MQNIMTATIPVTVARVLLTPGQAPVNGGPEVGCSGVAVRPRAAHHDDTSSAGL